jgi:hypothetical protein
VQEKSPTRATAPVIRPATKRCRRAWGPRNFTYGFFSYHYFFFLHTLDE